MAELNKDILITGAAGVIGSSIARRLAKSGYILHLTTRKLARLKLLSKELSQQGTRVIGYEMELSKPRQIERVVDRFIEKAERPYGLICNAGNLGALGMFLDVDLGDWNLGITENFLSPVRMIRAFARGLVRRQAKAGTIVAVSGGGVGGPSNFTHISSYRTAKAALTYFVEAVAPEFSPLGITINAVSPGQVLSSLTDTAIRAGARNAGEYAESARKCKESGGVPPEYTAELVELLIRPEARNITGRLLSARFDRSKLQQEMKDIAQDPNRYRLRRIDQELYFSKPQ